MGTGVGEAMLIGAVTGAGTSALTGNDPLKGALIGAAGGGATFGLGSALAPAATPAVSAGGSGLTAPVTDAATKIGTLQSGTGLTANAISSGADLTKNAVTSGMDLSAAAGGQGFKANLAALPTSGSPYSLSTADPSMIQNAMSTRQVSPFTETAGATQVAAAPDMKFMDVFKGDTGTFGERVGTYLTQNPKTTGAVGGSLATSAFTKPPGLPGEDEYKGPLSRFRYDPDRYRPAFAGGGIADLPAAMQYRRGGDLGMHSDGGRMTKDRSGGDGMSDEIPAMIGEDQPARLADGEFVVPADVVSHLGNGSTDAGARQLYAMMDKVRKARTGNEKQGKEINPRKMMPV